MMMLHPFRCVAPIHLARTASSHLASHDDRDSLLTDSLWLFLAGSAFMVAFPFVLTFVATLMMMFARIFMFGAAIHAMSCLFSFRPSKRIRCGHGQCVRRPSGTSAECSAKAMAKLAEDAKVQDAGCTRYERDGVSTSSSKPYRFTVNAPGVKQADLMVRADAGLMLVQGVTNVEGCTFKVEKMFALPEDANIDEATTTHEDGLLRFSVPRRALTTRSIQTMADTKGTDAHADAASKDVKEDKVLGSPGMRASCAKGSAQQGTGAPVLTDCDPDDKNIQHPDEKVQEHETGERHTQPERLDEEEAYLAGYQCALDDMMDQSPRTDENLSEVALSDEAHDEASNSLEVANQPSSETAAWDADWDDLLEDLQEMGFDDVQSNRLALTKHSGSIKRAVKDLMLARSSMC